MDFFSAAGNFVSGFISVFNFLPSPLNAVAATLALLFSVALVKDVVAAAASGGDKK